MYNGLLDKIHYRRGKQLKKYVCTRFEDLNMTYQFDTISNMVDTKI